MKTLTRMAATVFAVALVAAACDQGATSPAGTDGPAVTPAGPSLAVGDIITKPAATELQEKVVVCKNGPTATFTVEVASVEVTGSPFTINDGECVIVYQHAGETETVEVVENVPAGVQLDEVVKTQLTCKLGLGVNCDPLSFPDITGPTTVFTGPLAGPATSATFSGLVGGSLGGASTWGLSGALLEFTNSLIPTGGGEGCTPGFWKNRGLTLGWPAPYLTSDSYDATFGVVSGFGGTLLDALNAGGGGEIALGRHAVAALLNAASPDVDYDLSVAEVIQLVQDAYNSGDFEDAKDILQGFNEQLAEGFCE